MVFVQSDALEFLRSQKDASFDFIHADPPYNNFIPKYHREGSYDFNISRFVDMTISSEYLIEVVKECFRILKEGNFLLWMGYKQLILLPEFIKVGFNFRDLIIAYKYNHPPVYRHQILIPNFELCLRLVKGKGYIDSLTAYKLNKQRAVFEVSNSYKHRHTCMKNPDLMESLIQIFTKETDNCLDLFSGSRIFEEKCEKLGRRCTSVDLQGMQW
jgi:DNA modification methylase